MEMSLISSGRDLCIKSIKIRTLRAAQRQTTRRLRVTDEQRTSKTKHSTRDSAFGSCERRSDLLTEMLPPDPASGRHRRTGRDYCYCYCCCWCCCRLLGPVFSPPTAGTLFHLSNRCLQRKPTSTNTGVVKEGYSWGRVDG